MSITYNKPAIPKGDSKETTCTADSMRIIIGNNVEMA